jgi:septal ring factor EnvC (AmiA/AmiB activator)
MPPAKNDLANQELIKNLDVTHQLVRQLISDLREGEIDFAKLSTELNHLIAQFKELSHSLDQTDDLILNINLKIALLEKSVNDLENWVKEYKQKEQVQAMQTQIADKRGRWQMFAAVASGVIGIIGSLVSIIINHLNK